MTEKEKAEELLTFMEEEWDGSAIIKALKPLLRDSELADLYDKMTKEEIIRPCPDNETDTTTDKIKELQKEVNDILKEWKNTEVEVDKDEKVTVHLNDTDMGSQNYLKYVMSKKGFLKISDSVTEEDGSGWISMKHLFVKIDSYKKNKTYAATRKEEIQKEVYGILQDNNLTDAVVKVDKDEKVTVHLLWGDWKHDHGRLKYIMARKGFLHMSTKVTEEDGSDCYSAKHLFVKMV